MPTAEPSTPPGLFLRSRISAPIIFPLFFLSSYIAFLTFAVELDWKLDNLKYPTSPLKISVFIPLDTMICLTNSKSKGDFSFSRKILTFTFVPGSPRINFTASLIDLSFSEIS